MTQVDSFVPALFNVSIDLSGFTNSAPQDGAIDPTTIQRYMQIELQTGTQANPTVNDGDTITINGVSITFTTGGGLTLAGIITTINALTDDHHVIAKNDGSNHLQLANEPLYEDFGINMAGDAAVLTELGFNPPTITHPNSSGVDTLAHSEAKTRGNSRWNTMMKMINFEVTALNVGGVRKTGGSMTSAPTAISFTVAYQDMSQVYTYDESNNNALLKGVPALRRMVARALTTDRFEVQPVLNPEIVVNSSDVTETQALTIETGALSGSLSSAESVITITPISLVR